ncbi:MAG TPA: serine/threonine-protein kinase [Polyangiaceae bacterium]|nr:serine/threonine-protein kinase [Polyangiaceae bacterium]
MFPQVFGKYVFEREMARGGMARVFLATLRGAGGFEKRLVVKQIRPELASDEEFVRRFVAEAKTAVSLSHPNIVPVYELGVEQGIYYIAMELCEGVTLAELLRHQGALSASEGAYLGVEVCRALDYAHRRSVVHRDVTPGNVMIDAEGAVRLIDFGIAASVVHSAQGHAQVFGSLGHMSPEQLAGQHAGPVSDVFALGTVLIEAWTDRAPFRRDTLEEAQAALRLAPAKLSASNPQLLPLDALLARAVDEDPSGRPQSAEDFSRPLRDFLKSADTGDVARKLGRKVAQILAEREAMPTPSHDWQSEEPEQPTSGGNTRTFAAQPVLAEWTQPLPIAGEASVGPQTAKLVAASASQHRLMRVLLAIVVGIGLIALWLVLRGVQQPHALAPTVVIASKTVTTIPSVATGPKESLPAAPPVDPKSASAMLNGAAVSSAAVGPAIERHSSPSATGAASGVAAESKPPVAQGALTLSASPPCQVLVDGQAKGRTPVRGLLLPVGGHRVEFISDLTQEHLTTSIDLKEGQTPALHADFTAATPRLMVH